MSREKIIVGDCIEVLKTLEANSVDSVVTDPPYGISFMNKEWDNPSHQIGDAAGISGGFQKFPKGVKRPEFKRNDSALFQEWCEQWAVELLRVLKPGGHLLSFGATRTYHRMVSGIEDAGFEIRDSIHWTYGSGFPKSHDIQKAVAKKGVDRFSGWGTALKPSHEIIVLARKPFSSTVAENMMEHGVGGLNIDATRVGDSGARNNGRRASVDGDIYGHYGSTTRVDYGKGRWPANSIFSHSDSCRPTGEYETIKGDKRSESGHTFNTVSGFGDVHKFSDTPVDERDRQVTTNVYGDEQREIYECADDCPVKELDRQHAKASSFFYCVKPNKKEKQAGLEGKNIHTTVKPIKLMEYLIKLVTPEGGIVLDPFMGSGTTGCAAVMNNYSFIGIEQSAEYAEIAEKRIKHWSGQA